MTRFGKGKAGGALGPVRPEAFAYLILFRLFVFEMYKLCTYLSSDYDAARYYSTIELALVLDDEDEMKMKI